MDATVVSTFFEQARKLSDAAALKYKRDGEWVTITWSGYADLVRRAAGGLRSLGLEAGERAAILSTNRYEWHVADIAIQSCGGITVPIYPTNSPTQVAYIAGHAEANVIFSENVAQLAMPTSMAEPTTPPRMPIICMTRSAASSPARYCMGRVAALIATNPSREFRRLLGLQVKPKNHDD